MKKNKHFFSWFEIAESNLLSDKDIQQELLSFKFFQTLLIKKQKHLYLKFNENGKNIYFHGIFEEKKGLNYLDATYSGFIIPAKSKSFYIKNKTYINRQLSNYLRKKKIDILILHPYPLMVYRKNNSLPHEISFAGYKIINGFIIIEKNKFNITSYNQRYEIKKGLENLKKYTLITEKDEKCFAVLKTVLNKNIKQNINLYYIEKIFENSKKGLYKIYILLDKNEIVCLLIVSLRPGMASQTYNYISESYRKEFINKAIHYNVINYFFEKNLIDIFVFGDSIDDNNGMTSVTAFKQSFSEKALISTKIFHPISYIGKIFVIFKFFRELFYV